MDNVVFQEMDMFATGTTSYNFVELEAKPLTCEMYVGNSLALPIKDLEFFSTGVNGVVAGIDVRMKKMEGEMAGGKLPFVDASLEEPILEMGGMSEIVSSLAVVMQTPSINVTGDSSFVGRVDAEFRQLHINMGMTLNHQVGNMKGNLQPLQVRMTDVDANESRIYAMVRQIECEMQCHYDGINDIEARLEEPTIVMGSDVGQAGTCDLAETLEFED